MLLAVPKYGRVKVNKVLAAVPHLAEQDHRRPLAAPAHRAGLDAPPLAPLRLGKVFVITGPSGVGKGTLIRTLLERVPELELSVSATTRAPRPGGGARRRLPLPRRRGVRPARARRASSSSTPSYSGRRYGTLRSELERAARRGRPGRARDRGPGRAPGRARRCPRRCGSSSRRPREEALRTRLVGRGTDDPEQVEARLRPRRERARARSGEFAPRGRQRPPRGRRRGARAARARPIVQARLNATTAEGMISPASTACSTTSTRTTPA